MDPALDAWCKLTFVCGPRGWRRRQQQRKVSEAVSCPDAGVESNTSNTKAPCVRLDTALHSDSSLIKDNPASLGPSWPKEGEERRERSVYVQLQDGRPRD